METSWNVPALVNKILSDLPGIRTLLQALAKMDYTGTTDIPTGSVRMAQVEGGWQLQRYNGSQWVSVGKLIHDADSVDGKSASTTATADTIPVRDSSGKVPGDITGNAASADIADGLSTTLPISKGGTGATDAANARSNLGVPPTNHASTGTTYGLSSASQYGHAMAASDAPAQDTDAGAVGTDVTHFSRADHSHKKVLGTSTVYGQVKLTDSVSDVSDASSSVAASAKAVKEAYDKANSAATTTMTGATANAAGTSGNVPAPAAGQQDFFLRGDGEWAVAAGLPLGHFFTWPFSTPPDGSIIVNGTTYSRSLYADLWAYVSSHSDWVKTESEWQSIASSNGGYCPYYSSGNGSTTFRVPKFAPYQQLAISASNAGTYHQAGLPEIGGTFQAFASANATGTGIYKQYTSSSAPRYNSGRIVDGTGGEVFSDVAVNASPVYGRSDTVQPETHEWIVCVVAYGSATNVGNVDVANVMSAVSLAQAKAEEAVEIDSSGYSNGQRYIRFKNGVQFIWVTYFENQSSGRVTFCKPFNSMPCFISFHNSHADYIGPEWAQLGDLTSTYFTVGDWSFGSVYKNGDWLAIGTWK